VHLARCEAPSHRRGPLRDLREAPSERRGALRDLREAPSERRGALRDLREAPSERRGALLEGRQALPEDGRAHGERREAPRDARNAPRDHSEATREHRETPRDEPRALHDARNTPPPPGERVPLATNTHHDGPRGSPRTVSGVQDGGRERQDAGDARGLGGARRSISPALASLASWRFPHRGHPDCRPNRSNPLRRGTARTRNGWVSRRACTRSGTRRRTARIATRPPGCRRGRLRARCVRPSPGAP
jgi:hypothetical protein